MAIESSLPIKGYRGEPVPNRFVRRDGEARQLAILFPGMGYTCDMPVFYYAKDLLAKESADILRVDYSYNRRSDFRSLPEPEQMRWLLADATAAYRTGLSQRAHQELMIGRPHHPPTRERQLGYREVILIGKSLGTLAMGHLVSTGGRPPMRMRAVWITPLLRAERLREQVKRYGGPSLFAIGTVDSHYVPTFLAEVQQATKGEVVVVEGADHRLDVPGDVIASVKAVEQVIQALQAFLAR